MVAERKNGVDRNKGKNGLESITTYQRDEEMER